MFYVLLSELLMHRVDTKSLGRVVEKPDYQRLVDNNADWWEIWEVVLPVDVEQESSILCPALYSSDELIGDTDIIGFCAASEKKQVKNYTV